MPKEKVKNAAVRMVQAGGLINLSRAALCQEAGIRDGSFALIMGCTFTEFVEQLRSEGVKGPACPVKKSRTNPALREDHILECALAVAVEHGYQKVTRVKVAEAAGVSEALVSQYFGTMTQLRNAVMRQAVRREMLGVLAQGIVAKNPKALNASPELKRRAIATLSED